MYKALLYLELRVTQTAINRNSLPHKTCEHPLNKDKSLDHVEIRKMSLKGRTIELSDDLLETGGSQGAEPKGRGWRPARGPANYVFSMRLCFDKLFIRTKWVR